MREKKTGKSHVTFYESMISDAESPCLRLKDVEVANDHSKRFRDCEDNVEKESVVFHVDSSTLSRVRIERYEHQVVFTRSYGYHVIATLTSDLVRDYRVVWQEVLMDEDS